MRVNEGKAETPPERFDRKLALSFSGVLLLLVLTASVVASLLYARLQDREEDRLAGVISSILSESISRVSFSGKHHARILVEAVTARTSGLAYISVETKQGEILAHTDPAKNDTQVGPEGLRDIAKSLETQRELVFERLGTNGTIKEVVLPFRGGFDAGVLGVVRVGIDVASARREQKSTLLALLMLGAALTLMAVGVVGFLSRSFGVTVRTLDRQLQGVLTQAPLAIAISDRAGRILVQSAEFERLFGRVGINQNMEELLRRSLSERVVEDLALMDRQVLAGSGKLEREFVLEGTGPARIWQVVKSSIAEGQDEASALNCTIIRDVSDQRRLEEQLRQSQKMDAIGHLAGGIAHDFNNMLQTILGYVDMTLDELVPGKPLHDNVLEIQKAAQRSAALTRQLLAFARKQTVSPRVLDLNETVAGMLKMLRPLIGEDIQLVWIPGPQLWTVEIDPSQIDQMLANLAVNARDAIAGMGVVTIQTRNARLGASDSGEYREVVPGDYVELLVKDNGSGMDQRTQAQVFEPFFTTKGLGKGTGLGLATVYGIVKQNNGFIDVVSELGKGSTFRILLPRFKGEGVQPEPGLLEDRPKGGRETLLLVEDEESLLHLAKTILQRLGYTVLATPSPKEALRLAQAYSGPIPLLVTDVVMPEMNGQELGLQLKALRPEIRCLFISGYSEDIIAHRGVIGEGVCYLSKPFSTSKLAQKIREVLDAQREPPGAGPGT